MLIMSLGMEFSLKEKRFLQAAGLLSLGCIVFFALRILLTDTLRYWFVPENLLLAWISLIVAWFLASGLKRRRWASWQNISLSIIWLIFLPNSWYVLTDFIHVYPTREITELYDISLISLLVTTGFMLGFASLYIVHREFIARFSRVYSHLIVAAILLLSSFAIYLGRHLRWNTWDIIADPGGLALNVSDRLINPSTYPQAFGVTAIFFALLSLLYFVICWLLPLKPYSKKP